jgi:general transcription factor 3C polypeptide 5 (transcription factor C subunit 1)
MLISTTLKLSVLSIKPIAIEVCTLSILDEQELNSTGMTDFHYSTTHGKFMTKFRESVLSGKVEDLKKFKLDPSRGVKKNEELIPPPTLSDKIIPVNWGYHQNSTIKMTTDKLTGEKTLVNLSYVQKINTSYLAHDANFIPSGPPPLPPPDPILESLIVTLRAALEERPIWTRRAIMNHIPASSPGFYLLKPAIQYIGYQFRGGPWRDAIVKYGIDPRTDAKYRIYQTLFFKIVEETLVAEAGNRKPWHDTRSEYTRKTNRETQDRDSHIFDGTSISLDGKIWQVCDITDPLLVRLLKNPPLRDKCDVLADGWYCNGTWAKVRSVMRTKITAIRMGREVLDEEFKNTLAIPDVVVGRDRVTAPKPRLKPKKKAVVRENPRKNSEGESNKTVSRSSKVGSGQVPEGGKPEGSRKADVNRSNLGPEPTPDRAAMISGARMEDDEDRTPSGDVEDDLAGEQDDEDIEDYEDDEGDLDPDDDYDGDSEDGEGSPRDADDWGGYDEEIDAIETR